MIRHSKPYFDEKEFGFVDKILKSANLSINIYVQKFEEEFSKFIDKRYSVSTNSGTNALFLSLYSIKEIKKISGYVLIPSFNCTAILNAVLMAGYKPIMCDVNKIDFSYDIDKAKKLIDKNKIKIVILPYLFGYPSYSVFEFKKMGLYVIEDITQALGSSINGVMTGKMGDIVVSSFYATKMITTLGEGGIISTDDKEIYEFVKDVIDYDKKDDFRLRFSFKMNEAGGYFGISQLKRINFIIRKRKKIAKLYSDIFSKKKGVKIFYNNIPDAKVVFYRYIVELINYKRDEIIDMFKKYGVEVSKLYLPLDVYYQKKSSSPVSTYIYNNFISIPIYPALRDDEIKKVIDSIEKIFL
jgi:perosamine synthetase